MASRSTSTKRTSRAKTSIFTLSERSRPSPGTTTSVGSLRSLHPSPTSRGLSPCPWHPRSTTSSLPTTTNRLYTMLRASMHCTATPFSGRFSFASLLCLACLIPLFRRVALFSCIALHASFSLLLAYLPMIWFWIYLQRTREQTGSFAPVSWDLMTTMSTLFRIFFLSRFTTSSRSGC